MSRKRKAITTDPTTTSAIKELHSAADKRGDEFSMMKDESFPTLHNTPPSSIALLEVPSAPTPAPYFDTPYKIMVELGNKEMEAAIQGIRCF